MKRLQRILSFLILVSLLLPLALSAQLDCDCPPDGSWDAALEKANVVFLGTCIGVRSNPIKGGMNAIFAVDSSWKRRIEPNATVHTAASNMCGYAFEEGKRYVVFGNKRHQTVETSLCEPNELIGKNDDASLAKLGAGFGPGRPEMGRKMNMLLIGLGVAGLLFVGLVVLRKRIFKKKTG